MSYTGLGSLTKRKAEMQGRQEAARAVGLICSPNAHDQTRKGRRAVDLPCSPNARTRSIVLLEGRCSSKRAVGDQPALAQGESAQGESSKIWKKLRCSPGKRPKYTLTFGMTQPAPYGRNKLAWKDPL